MAETAYFVNASDLFEAIELGDCEQQEFLDQFTYGGNRSEEHTSELQSH